MELNKYTIIINKDEDGWFIADVPALIGCHTQGKTREEALENIKDVIKLCEEELKN